MKTLALLALLALLLSGCCAPPVDSSVTTGGVYEKLVAANVAAKRRDMDRDPHFCVFVPVHGCESGDGHVTVYDDDAAYRAARASSTGPADAWPYVFFNARARVQLELDGKPCAVDVRARARKVIDAL